MKTVFKSQVAVYLICFLFFSAASFIYCQQSLIRKDAVLSFLKEDNSVIVSIDVEIAETSQSHIKGLMFRELKDFSSGMLFLFQDVRHRNFWMRNTPTSLDIIFVGEDLRVINIAEKTKPMSDTTYSSQSPAKYVVEVKGGFAEKYKIEAGDKISWEKLTK